MKAGAHNAVRGSSAPVEELQYIYNNSRSMGAVLESPNLLTTLYENGGLNNELGKPKFIVILNNKGEIWKKKDFIRLNIWKIIYLSN